MIKDFTTTLRIPEKVYPIDETYFKRYYLVSFVGSSCRLHYDSENYNDVIANMELRQQLKPDLKFAVLKLNINLQKILDYESI